MKNEALRTLRCGERLEGVRLRVTDTMDGVRIHAAKGCSLRNVTITDDRPKKYKDDAHSDGIQLIPAARGEAWSQYAAAPLRDVDIDGCVVDAPDSQMQGMFSSDGYLGNIHITDGTINTASQHKITLRGLVSGFIAGNRLPDGALCPVVLKPLRIGGRPAIGNRVLPQVLVVGFSHTSDDYQSISDIIARDDGVAHVTDVRTVVDATSGDVYLTDFDLQGFRAEARAMRACKSVHEHCLALQRLAIQHGTVVAGGLFMTEHNPNLGHLSAKYESAGRLGAIGYDRTGGWSYGRYQIATKVGTMGKFIGWLANHYRGLYNDLKRAGGESAAKAGRITFKQAWQGLARSRKDWSNVQHYFIQQTHYDPVIERLQRMGFDVNERSAALRDVIWSTAVQHGPHTNVVSVVVGRHRDADDATLIRAIYQERRGRFGSSTRKVRAAVMRRFDEEQREALAYLSSEAKPARPARQSPAAPPPKPAPRVRPAPKPKPITKPRKRRGFFNKSRWRNL